jgi:hypothetical protein
LRNAARLSRLETLVNNIYTVRCAAKYLSRASPDIGFLFKQLLAP